MRFEIDGFRTPEARHLSCYSDSMLIAVVMAGASRQWPSLSPEFTRFDPGS